jgi:hypothetical protein
VEHFASFGLNMHLGTRGTGKKSKTECLFCSAPPAAYTDPSTYDGTDLSDTDMGNGKSIQVVPRYPSLGTIISGDSSCEPEIHRRIGLGYGSMAKMKNKVYGSKYVPWSTQVATYETITPTHCPLRLKVLDRQPGLPRQARSIQQRGMQPLAHARVRHHQCLATETERNANHDVLSRATANVMAWSRRPHATITHPKTAAHGRGYKP